MRLKPNKEPMSAFNLCHRLWTKSVGKEGYNKAEWRAMERMVLTLELQADILVDVLRGTPMLPPALVDRIMRLPSLNPRDHEKDIP